MKYLLTALLVFFLVPTLLPAQVNIVVLPPMSATRTLTPPPPELQKIIVDFNDYYEKEVGKIITPNQLSDSWLVLTILLPRCGDHSGWCIVVTAAKEERGAKAVVIVRIPIADKTSFDFAAEAKRAAQKTKYKIGGQLLPV